MSGLPFVYLWPAPERPVMAYGTIPVFAAAGCEGGDRIYVLEEVFE